MSGPWKCHWYQFSLRTLMVFVTLCAVACSWLAVRIQRGEHQRRLVHLLDQANIVCRYDYQVGDSMNAKTPPPPGPDWLRGLLGVDFLADVVSVYAYSGDGLERLRELPHLRDVNLVEVRSDDAPITDENLRVVAGITQVQELYIASDHITDKGLEAISGLNNLQELNVTCSGVTAAGLKVLESLTTLRSLTVSCENAKRPWLHYVKNLERLEELSVVLDASEAGRGDIAPGDDDYANLKGLRHLRALYLTDSGLRDGALSHLVGLGELRHLDISGCPVSDAGMAHVAALTQLQDLRLASTEITDVGLEHLKGLRQLKTLQLDNTKITDAGLKYLKGLSQLQELVIRDTKVTGRGLKDLQKALPTCMIDSEWVWERHKGVGEIAGQKRQGVADKRAVRERASDPSRP